jgi:hypothetical protein
MPLTAGAQLAVVSVLLLLGPGIRFLRAPVIFTFDVAGPRLTSVKPKQIEQDVQDVFITRIVVEDGGLRVENELGKVFEMDLATGRVKAVAKRTDRTALPDEPKVE